MSYRGGGGGYSRGYRGSRGDTQWRGSSRGNFAGSSRGGGRFYSSSPSPNYEPRSRPFFQGNDRFSNRGRPDDTFHRSSYRTQETQDYSRDFVMRGSPEPPRKRVRTESSYSGAASRRSHERSFGSSGNEYSRSYFIGDKGSGGGYAGDKGSYRDVRESRSNDFSFRKPAAASRSPRGSFRGRTFSSNRGRGRGYIRSGLSTTGFISRKRALAESYTLRNRYLSTKSTDYLRRLKLYRLKRSFKNQDSKKSDDDDDEDGDDVEDKEEEGEVDEVSSQDGNEADEKEEGEVEGDNKDEEEEEEEDEREQTEEGDGKEKPVKKMEKKEKKLIKKPIKKLVAESEEVKGIDTTKRDLMPDPTKFKNSLGQPFIRLKCPHCHYACVTFKEYGYHLGLKKHQLAMRSLSTRLRQTLARMRIEQRQRQRVLDDESKIQGNMHLRTFFCSICKLNYRTLKSHHQSTITHKKMREFLMPFCKICSTPFKSPMLYEAHLCDLMHIKRKAKLDRKRLSIQDEEDDGVSVDLDTNSFMVLDAVGSGDDDSDMDNDDVENEKSDKPKTTDGDEAEKKMKKKRTELGAEYCKLVEGYYCELCKLYLPRLEDTKRALTIHCRSRTHLQRWTREVKRRKSVKLKEAEIKLEKKTSEEEDKEEEVKGEGEVGEPSKIKQEKVDKEEGSKEQVATGTAEGKKFSDESVDMDDKLWSVVDKDLSELLTEVGDANKSSDEDEDSRAEGGRYDRFKHSDKNLDKSIEGKGGKVDEEEERLKGAVVTPSSTNQTNGSMSQQEKKNLDDTNNSSDT